MTAVGAAPELTVLGEIAAGGMGTVELARMVDASGESLVAVKRMHREHSSDPEFVRMFRDEIWLMGALRHPNIVPLIGWGEDEAGPYLVMQYIDGVALGRIAGVGRRALQPIREHLVAYVAARAAEGLHAAHHLADEQGRPLEIVHRDVTPSNVLVAFDGGVLVTDFGIAKAAGKSSHTRTGVIKGKIAYMSPEYSVRRAVDGRSDLYSLGVVMYELLSGELPFEARTDFELLKKVAYSPAPRLESVAPEVELGLAAIVDRLLAKEPSQRPADGAELARELDAWLSDHGFRAEDVRAELASYAAKHAGEKHKLVKQLLDPEADTVPDDGSGPKRPKFITLGTRTFTLFDPAGPTSADGDSSPGSGLRKSKPDVTPSGEIRASRPDARPEEERPRTRRVAVSDFPPPSAPFAAPVTPPPQSAPSVSAVVTEARPSSPPPSPDASQRISSARASVPPAGGLTPVVAIRAHSSALLGGVVAGSIAALVLVVVTVVVTLGRRSEPPVSAQEPAPAASEVPAAPPVSAAPEPVERPPPVELPPASSVGATPSVRPPRLPPAGKPPRLPTKVSKPPKGKPPCTPTSFDYPACLSG